MKKYVIVFLAISAILVSGYSPAIADDEAMIYGSWYGGGGISFISISSDEEIYADGTEAAGFQVLGGYKFNKKLSLEVYYTGIVNSNMIGSILAFGPRLYILDLEENMVVPWLGAYLAAVSLESEEDNLSIDSLSPSVAGGIDLKIGPNSFIEIGVRYYSFSDDFKQGSITLDKDVDTEIFEVAISYVFHEW